MAGKRWGLAGLAVGFWWQCEPSGAGRKDPLDECTRRAEALANRSISRALAGMRKLGRGACRVSAFAKLQAFRSRKPSQIPLAPTPLSHGI